MLKSISVFILSVVLTGLLGSPAYAAEWPLDRSVDLSSGFGDFRDGHFHAGVDLRTGGRIGVRVTAPADGYVWRVKTSYFGYGKALYYMDNEDNLYVFGHLSRYDGPIDQRLKEAQAAARRYYQDLRFSPDELRYRKGQLLAYTGQSGSGGPHLHFEKRVGPEHLPVNPLTQGYSVDDRVRPTLTRFGIQLVDEHSLFDDGRRKAFFDLRSTGAGVYAPDTLLYLHRPLGLLLEGYDRMRTDGMKQGIYQISVFIDDKLFYESRMDTVDYANGHLVRLEYDLTEASEGRKRVRRLFKIQGNTFSGSGGRLGPTGHLGRDLSLPIGRHEARLVARDVWGNESVAVIPFLWGPPGDIFTLDSTIKIGRDTTEFFFTGAAGWEKLDVDSILVLRNRSQMWGQPPTVTLTRLDGGRLKVRAVGAGVDRAVLRLFLFSGNGVIRDNIFNGLRESAPDRCDIHHEVLEDGLLIHVEARVINGALGQARLYYRDTLLGIEPLQYLDMTRHACFIPPQSRHERIDRIGVTMTRDTTAEVYVLSDTLHIRLVGQRKHQRIDYDEYFSLELRADDFPAPRFIEIRSTTPNRIALGLNSNHYQILPKAFPTRRGFDLLMRPIARMTKAWSDGVCWLDEEKDRWVWLDHQREEDGFLRARSNGGGSFALVFDHEAPQIRRLSIFHDQVLTDRTPLVSFVIEDALSGIGDDRNILIKLDGEWLIPEYDPETGMVRTRPLEPLDEGRHHLAIEVTDRAGKKTEQYLQFTVSSTKKR